MAAIAEQGHANILLDPPITPGPVSVTMPGLGLLVSRAIRLSAPDIEASVMGGEPGRGVTSMLLPPPVWGFSVDPSCANSRLEAEIAQRKAAADQLHQAQKMEALGQLKQPFLWRKNIVGVLRANTLVFWNIEKN